VLHMKACCITRGQLISSWESIWGPIACKINHKLFSELLRFPFALCLEYVYFIWLLEVFFVVLGFELRAL
jgi:hypothetical protein